MKKLITLSALALVSAYSQADIRINGFANMVGGITSSDETLYGYYEDMSYGEESIFALQVSSDINKKMTATAQVIARAVDNYQTEFEWAYLTYAATDNLKISTGRLRQPLFRYSDSLDVSYSYHWVNAPKAIYDVPFNNIEGFKFDYNNSYGNWDYDLQMVYGVIAASTDALEFSGDNTFLLSGEFTYDYFKIRVVHATSDVTVDVFALRPLRAQLEPVIPTQLYNDMFGPSRGRFIGLGLELDRSNWFLAGELTEAGDQDKGSTRPTISYYVTAGLRTGKWTPSITYEGKESDDKFKHVNLISQLPAELQQTLYGLQTVQDVDYEATTLGVRYDFDTNVALKTDFVKYTDNLNSANDAKLVRIAINYVF